MGLTVALGGGKISPCPPRRELDSPVACGNVGAVIPRDLNAAHWFVDRHVEEGRDGRLAIVYEGQRLTYGDVYAGANRVGNMLRRLGRSEEHTSELQSQSNLVCRLLLEKKNTTSTRVRHR